MSNFYINFIKIKNKLKEKLKNSYLFFLSFNRKHVQLVSKTFTIILPLFISSFFVFITENLGYEISIIKDDNAPYFINYIFSLFVFFSASCAFLIYLLRFGVLNSINDKRKLAKEKLTELKAENKNLKNYIHDIFTLPEKSQKNNFLILEEIKLMKNIKDIEKHLNDLNQQMKNPHQDNKKEVLKIKNALKESLICNNDTRLNINSLRKQNTINSELLVLIYKIPLEYKNAFIFLINNNFSIEKEYLIDYINSFIYVIEELQLDEKTPYKEIYFLKKYIGNINSNISLNEIEKIESLLKENDFLKINENFGDGSFLNIQSENGLTLQFLKDDTEKKLKYLVNYKPSSENKTNPNKTNPIVIKEIDFSQNLHNSLKEEPASELKRRFEKAIAEKLTDK